MGRVLVWLPFVLIPMAMIGVWCWRLVTYYDPVRTTIVLAILVPPVFALVWKQWFGVRLRSKKKKKKKTRKFAEAVFYTSIFAVGGAVGTVVSLLFLNQTVASDAAPIVVEYVDSSTYRPRTRRAGRFAVTALDFRLPGASGAHRLRRWPSGNIDPNADGTVVVCRASGLLGLGYYYYPKSGQCD